MTIKGKRKRKIVARSVFCLILSLSIFLSSLGISFAYNEGSLTTPESIIESTPTTVPQGSPFYGPTLTNEVLGLLYDETARIATMFHIPTGGNTYGLLTIASYNELVFVPNGIDGVTSGIYSRTPDDALCFTFYDYSSSFNIATPHCGTMGYTLPGFDGTWYSCEDGRLFNLISNATSSDVYCNGCFYILGSNFAACENLDITGYLPRPTYLFEANLGSTDDNLMVQCKVNFNPREYSSFITIWGYNEYSSVLYIFNSSEYMMQIEDDQGNEPMDYIFWIDLSVLASAYVGSDFHISSISCMGWSDAHEEFLSVDWDFSTERTPTEYDSPNEYYYYSNFYNENYSYNDDNGNAVAFGYTTVYASNDLTVPCIWDSDNTLIEPYKFSYIAIPHYSIPSHYLDYILPSLSLSYDVIIVDCNIDVWCTIYDEMSIAEFVNYLDFTNNDTFSETFNSWYLSHPPGREPLPYSLKNDKPTYTYSGNAGILYTYSYFYKSMLYLFGDTNQYLLEIETRLLGEDGAFQEINKSLSKLYENDFSYYSDMLTYMEKINYLVYELVSNDYFAKYLLHLESIDSKLSDISNALTGTNEEDFDNELHAPWLQIYRYFKTLFNRSLAKLPDFIDTTTEILDGGSDQVGIGFTLDNDYEQALPLNSPSVSPTPIPIPTLFP